MTTIRREFEQRGFDEVQYAIFFAKNNAEHLRKKLRTILLYHQQVKVPRIALLLSLGEKTVRTYLATYTEKGFEGLCEKIKRTKESRLTEQQQLLFKELLVTKRPDEVGLLGNIWTGKIMCQYLAATFGVYYRAGIYDLLHRLGLTHQKAHADYGNAKQEQQQAFLEDLKSTVLQADQQQAVVFFDEFSVCEKPTAYYGWAAKNTRPTVVTNEKKHSYECLFRN